MGGITNPSFASTCLELGAGKVSIGGYPVGIEMVRSCHQMIKRGRREFVLPVGEEAESIVEKIEPLQRNINPNELIINLRISNLTDAQRFARVFSTLIGARPIIEVNVHCRQPEVTNTGGGQALLQRNEVLRQIIETFHRKDFLVSLKFRGNAVSAEKFLPMVNLLPLDFLHIDSYHIGEIGTDLSLLRSYSQATMIPIIGNNSIVDRRSALAALNTGARYFSLARAAEKNPVIFQSLRNVSRHD
ncbi:MAG: hypothetical protein ACFFFG_13945 [Candidatus Thorarchaeota archaeon]